MPNPFYVAPDPNTGGAPGTGVPAGSPTGDGSASSPWDVATALASFGTSTVGMILPGIYRGADSMLVFPSGTEGLQLIGVDQSVNTLFDGEWTNATVNINRGCCFIRLEGFSFRNSLGYGLIVAGQSTDVTVHSFVGWNDHNPAKPYMNHHLLQLGGEAKNVTLERFGVFGQCDRKMLSISGLQENTGTNEEAPVLGAIVRNGWVRWDTNYLGANTNSGNRGAVFPMYRSHDTLIEDVIGTCGGGTGVLPDVGTDPLAYEDCNLFGSDTACTSQPLDRVTFRRCAAIGPATVRNNKGGAFRITGGADPQTDPPKSYTGIEVDSFIASLKGGQYRTYINFQTAGFGLETENRFSVGGYRYSTDGTTGADQFSPDWANPTLVQPLSSANPVPTCMLPYKGQRHVLADWILAACDLSDWDRPSEFQLGGDWSQLYV